MPWPDESVFVISGRDLIEKGIWHLPVFTYLGKTYDIANFNIMPLHPILAYLWAKIASIQKEQYLVLFQIFFGLTGIYGFGKFLERSGLDSRQRFVLWAYILFFPFFYFCSHVIRPEAFIYPVLILLLTVILPSFEKNRILKALATGAILGWSANLHYNAIVMVPFVIIFLFNPKEIKRSLFNLLLVAIFTLIFMIPWLYYVGTHLADFKLQFLDQTNRMYSELHKDNFFKAFFLSTFYTTTLGIIKNDILYELIIFVKALGTALFFFLAIVAIVKKSISANSIKLLFCFIVAVLFCSKHRESWFIIYAETVMAIATTSIAIDLFKSNSKLPRFLYSGSITGLIFIITLFLCYPCRYFSKNDWNNMIDCLASGINQNETVVVNAIPDPSLALILKKPSINIFRMIDYNFYKDEWKNLINRENLFISARYDQNNFNGIDGIKFDHNGILKDKLTIASDSNLLETKICRLNNIPIYLHRIRKPYLE